MTGRKKTISTSAAVAAGLALAMLSTLMFLLAGQRSLTPAAEKMKEEKREIKVARDEFGFKKGNYYIEEGMVRRGQTLSHLLSRFDFGPADIDQVARTMEGVFSPRRIRGGNNYFGYYNQNPDTLSDLC